MSGPTWESAKPPRFADISIFGYVLAALRAIILVSLIFICMPFMLICRFFERLLVGAQRPISSFFPRFVSRNALRLLGIKLKISGEPMLNNGAIVANHSSWLDIFVLNACQRVFFVSKAEVAKWPGIGAMAKATGTVFINRNRAEAAKQKEVFNSRLTMGHKLLFFPEGTSTDGQQVIPFKSTLFAAFFAPEIKNNLYIQPVSVKYIAPLGQDDRFYAWWGDLELSQSLRSVLSVWRRGKVEVTFHAPLPISQFQNRKEIALQAEETVRSVF